MCNSIHPSKKITPERRYEIRVRLKIRNETRYESANMATLMGSSSSGKRTMISGMPRAMDGPANNMAVNRNIFT